MVNYDVVIKSKGMGNGDEALTSILLQAFIHSLTEREHLPEHIILYAEGVQNISEDSASIEAFKELAKKGVDILSCGTCLDYYQLADKLGAGRSSNMQEIVGILSSPNKVIEP